MSSTMFILKDRERIICCRDFTINIIPNNSWGSRTSHKVVIRYKDTTEPLYEGTEAECNRWFKELLFYQLKNSHDHGIVTLENTIGSVNGLNEFLAQKCNKRDFNVVPLAYVYDQYLRFARHEFPLAPMDLEDNEKEKHDYPTKNEFVKLLNNRIDGYRTISIEEGRFIEDIEVNDSIGPPSDAVPDSILDKIDMKKRAIAASMP